MPTAKEYRRSKHARRRPRQRQGTANMRKNTQPKDRHLRHAQAKLDLDVEPTGRARRRGRHFQLSKAGCTSWGWGWHRCDALAFFGCEEPCCMPRLDKRHTMGWTPGDDALVRHMSWPSDLVRLPVVDSPRAAYYYDHVNATLYVHWCDCDRCENGPHPHCRRNPRVAAHARQHVLPSELRSMLPFRACATTS